MANAKRKPMTKTFHTPKIQDFSKFLLEGALDSSRVEQLLKLSRIDDWDLEFVGLRHF